MRMASIPTVAHGPWKATASARPPRTRAIANAAYTSHSSTARVILPATARMILRYCDLGAPLTWMVLPLSPALPVAEWPPGVPANRPDHAATHQSALPYPVVCGPRPTRRSRVPAEIAAIIEMDARFKALAEVKRV